MLLLDGFFWVLVVLVSTHLSVVAYLIRRGRSLEERSLTAGQRSTCAAAFCRGPAQNDLTRGMRPTAATKHDPSIGTELPVVTEGVAGRAHDHHGGRGRDRREARARGGHQHAHQRRNEQAG
jgi:hypothetical protein